VRGGDDRDDLVTRECERLEAFERVESFHEPDLAAVLADRCEYFG
jgi:hypothetical protein